MLAELLIGGSSILAAGGGALVGHQIRNSFGRVPHTKPKELTLVEVMQRGNKAVAQMARDVHKLYHPDDEDGNPCACAMCEIRADDEEDEDEPELTPKQANDKRKWVNGQYNDCATHRDGGCVCQREGMPPCGKWVEKNAGETETDRLKQAVQNLEDQLKHLAQAYAKLKGDKESRVVTKTVERKSLLDQKIEELSRLADREGQPLVLTIEHDGRTLQVAITPQREPDEQLVSFGGEVVRDIWHDKPATITHQEPLKALGR